MMISRDSRIIGIFGTFLPLRGPTPRCRSWAPRRWRHRGACRRTEAEGILKHNQWALQYFSDIMAVVEYDSFDNFKFQRYEYTELDIRSVPKGC